MTRPVGNLLRYAVSPVSWPLTLPYAVGARLKNIAYDRHWIEPGRLRWPVISVGNLSVGGTGKTPMVLLLADALAKLGWTVDVLTRGYGRSSQKVERVDPLGTPDEFGDEPLLMARRGLAVYVGAHRYHPGNLAESFAGADLVPGRRLHLLDDGFQHRKLARTIDIVLVQRGDLDGRLLPAGRLREPLSAIGRADICVLRAEDLDLSDRVLQQMRRGGSDRDPAHVWIVDRRTTLPSSPPSTGKALAFCAIGDANGFFEGLQQTGIDLREKIAFRDHHVYTKKDMQRLTAAARRRGAEFFVTTEKDNVRLPSTFRAEIEQSGPLLIAELELSLRDEARTMGKLESLLNRRLHDPRRDVR